MASVPLRVDPVDVHIGGADAASAAATAAAAFARHEDALAEAESGWIGASRDALSEFSAKLAAQNIAAHASVNALSEKLAQAAAVYASTDDDGGQALAASAEDMGL